MASINFLYRSTKKIAPLTVRLLFRHEGKDYTFGAKTKYAINADQWKEYRKKRKQSNDIEFQNFKADTDRDLQKIEIHILERFFKANPTLIDNDWIKDVVAEYYEPKTEEKKAPDALVAFFDFYLNAKKHNLSVNRLKRIQTTANKLKRFEKHTGKTYKIEDVDTHFKNDFIDYCDLMQYSDKTQETEFSIIKTVCRYAIEWNIPVSRQLNGLRITAEPEDYIYLSFDELEQIKELDLSENERLNKARDWLLISCYTGQRISDFMRFDVSMIQEVQGKYLLNFIQQKGKKQVTIPFLPEAKAVFDKRDSFPKPISHQKYNDYIKEVCRLAGICTPTKGKKRESIAPEGQKPKRTDYRMISGTFEKWELVSSHIGRRSFATNYYGKVPTSVLIGITGHSTERMFLNYIHKADEQKAVDAFKYF